MTPGDPDADRDAKKKGVVFRFDTIEYGKKTGALEVRDRSGEEDFDGSIPVPDKKYKFYLLAGETTEPNKLGSGPPFSLEIRKIHRSYRTLPSYEEAKDDVIKILSGEWLEPIDDE